MSQETVIKKLAVGLFSVLIALLLFWWSGLLNDMGYSGPIDFIIDMISLFPAWLWAIAIIFVVGIIAIERYF